MHDVGDALIRAGFADPVLDVDRLTVTWQNADALFRDLTSAGARNSLRARKRSLVGKGCFRRMTGALHATGGGETLALEFELVYGHCWGVAPRDTTGHFLIDADRIPLRRS